MNSSGIKRGLATVAVSALAVSGLGAFAGSAHADSLVDQADQAGTSSLNLVTQANGAASAANDGVDQKVHLVATAGSDVTKVKFSYTVGGGAEQVIDTVARANGVFSAYWAPTGNEVNATIVLTVQGLDAAGANVGAAVTRTVTTAHEDAVAITTQAGSSVGAYAAVDTDELKVAVHGSTNGDEVEVDGVDAEVAAPNASGISTFSGVQTLDGYTWDDTDPKVNEALLLANAPGGADDAQPVKLYEQTITAAGFTATAARSSVPAGEKTDVTVTVKDAQGQPIAGARVVNSAAATDYHYTDAHGQAVFEAGKGEHKYHVDTTDVDGYDDATDFQRTVSITDYTQTLAGLDVTASATAIVANELSSATFEVSATDQNGAAWTDDLPGNLRAEWKVAPFDGSAATTQAATVTNGVVTKPTGSVDGTYTLSVWRESDGNPGQGSGELAALPVEVKIGKAAFDWDATNGTIVAAPGTDVTVKGAITLADGTALAKREATVDLTNAGDVVFAPGQPEGTTRVNATQVTVTTAADGSFRVKVSDPVTTPTQGTHQDVKLTATATNVLTKSVEIDFVQVDADDVAWAQSNVFDGAATPGRPVTVDGVLKNKGGQVLANTAVELSVDKGFFAKLDEDTTADQARKGLVPDVDPADGGLWGDWASDGTTASVVTDKDGKFSVVVAIEGDEDFDDDGAATVTVTARAGAMTQTEQVDFVSEDALNVSAVELSHAVGQTSTVLPKARVDQSVNVDVAVFDQFGNRTSAQVDFDSEGPGTVAPHGPTVLAAHQSVTSNFTDDEEGALRLSSDTPGVQSLSVTFTGEGQVWKNTAAENAPAIWSVEAPAPELVMGSDALDTQWYAIDFAASSYELTHDGTEWNPVGKVITTTYAAADQEGQPIKGMEVSFFRAGPDDLQDGSGNTPVTTGAQGKATYTFQGAKEGTAVVSTVVRTPGEGGVVVPEAAQDLSINFGTEPVEPEPTTPDDKPKKSAITAKVTGKNNGKKVDRLTVVTTPAAKGATAVLQVKKANGKWKKVQAKVLNKNGKKAFKVKDTNGKKKTAYRVKVKGTATTKKAFSKATKVR